MGDDVGLNPPFARGAHLCLLMARKWHFRLDRPAASLGGEQFWGRAVQASGDSEEPQDASYF
jgi:hypothetical protein